MSISSSSSSSAFINGGGSFSSRDPSMPTNGFISGSFKLIFEHWKQWIASSSLPSTDIFKACGLKDLETSSCVNSSHVFSIHLAITGRDGDFRFPAPVRFLIPSVDNHSSYSPKNLALNSLFDGMSGDGRYFVQPCLLQRLDFILL